MTVQEYSTEQLAAQPIGYWSGATMRHVVGAIRAELAAEQLTQPHWWTLNHVAGAPGEWGRARLTDQLAPFDDQGSDFEAVYGDLVARGWLTEESGTFVLTEAGEAGRRRAKERLAKVNERVHEGISPGEYAAALNVLRRMVDNLGGDSDLPRATPRAGG
ncbi:MarR family transcriptional regulator [Streptomyces sp. NPDC006645]|uniref:MarR family winged helix-turn-helix transcriptional regulator n=1 Tax=unclassified Streptomyces TaxID=2593676 RepID=UPI0033A466E0